MPTAYVYYLADPRTPRWPRYVGHTENPESRANSHAKATANNNYPLGDWKRSLKLAGVAAELVIVGEYASRLEAREAEWRLIRRWQRRGLCDFNIERGDLSAWALMCRGKYWPRWGGSA